MDLDKFPEGMRVLAVDDDCMCLKIVDNMLRICKYEVTSVLQAEVALQMLRARKGRGDQFHLLLTDVHMPGMDGFKLLEIITIEMINIPVISNDELEFIVKGIKSGACDYLVKPIRLEKLKSLWTHVVKKGINSGNVDAGQKLLPGDADGEKECTKKTKKYTRKKKNDGHGTEVDNASTSTQKKQRIQWSGELHSRFVEVVNTIGMDRAVPKKILEMMNVRGLGRENVASHLQKYRMYLKKVSLGTFKLSNPFHNEHGWNRFPTSLNNGPESSTRKPELGTYRATPTFPGSPSSSNNPFPRTNSTSAIETRSSLVSTQSEQLITAQRNLVISRNDMRSVGQGGSLLKDAGAPRPQQDANRFITFGGSHINMSGASKMFHSGPSGSSTANSSDGIEFINTSKSSPSGSSGIRFASPPQAKSTNLSSYASILRRKLLGASRGIPVDDDDDFQSIAGGDMLTSKSLLPTQSPELANHHSVQMLPSSADLFGETASYPSRFARLSISTNNRETAVPSEFDDLGHMDGMFEGDLQDNDPTVDQFLELLASSCQMPDSGNEFQNQMDIVMSEAATPMADFNNQMPPVNLGGNRNSIVMPNDNSGLGTASNIIYTLPNAEGVMSEAATAVAGFDYQMAPVNLGGNRNSIVMPNDNCALGTGSNIIYTLPNGEGTSGNLPANDSTVALQAVPDEVNNSIEPLVAAGEAREISGDLLDDDFFIDFNDDFFTNNAFMDGDFKFDP